MANERARFMRKNPTPFERLVWWKLKEFRARGFHFRRQVPLGPYIVDFLCFRNRLIVEIDGDQHGMATQQVHDAARTRWLERKGFRVLRFSNREVEEDLVAVAEHIFEVLSGNAD
ncbi:MAG: endonuclease domain-containing protein [Alphaproteobacteria bacterium]|nr:endonuclease domain-containing protein [Alphaproteobacteria bacterium]